MTEKYKNLLFVGIGNRLRSDDGVGSILAQRLEGRLNIIDVAAAPENYLGKIVQLDPEEVWLIDAVDFKASAGTWQTFKAQDLGNAGLYFTHNCSLELFSNYLSRQIDVPIFILGIQPKSVAFGQDLSQEVTLALPGIEEALIKIAQGVAIEYLEKGEPR